MTQKELKLNLSEKKKVDAEMIKLMSNPTEVKKRVKSITKGGNKVGTKPEWFLLKQGGNSVMVDKLMRVYKENPHHAYVLNKNNAGVFTEVRWLLFVYSDKHFEIVQFEKKFGMSKTNRIYSTKKKISSIIYKDNKVWYYGVNGKIKTIKPLTINKLKQIICDINDKNIYGLNHDEFILRFCDTFIYKFFDEKFFWFKTLMEYRFGDNLTLNTIISKKLFGFDKLNRHVFQINKAASTRLIESGALFESPFGSDFLDKNSFELNKKTDTFRLSNIFYNWKKIIAQFDGLEHFDFKIIKQNETIFFDTLRMAEKLNKKISGRWGFKKLESMHDLWSVEVQNILLDCEIERNLNIAKVYEDFANFSGYRLMRTNKDLLREGMRQNHCVGTYIDRVDAGSCAIYDVENYTLQLSVLEFNEIKTIEDYHVNPKVKILFIKCFNATLKTEEHHRKILRSEYSFKQTPEYDELIKNGFWLHNSQFKGKFNKEAPETLRKEVQKKLHEFSLNYDFESIYERYKKPTQEDLEFKSKMDNRIAVAIENIDF